MALFTAFVERNADLIKSESSDFIPNEKIEYSEKAYIDFNRIWELSDDDTKKIIWDHIIVIATQIDSTCVTKKAKKEIISKQSTSLISTDQIKKDLNLPDNKEGDMMTNIIQSVSSSLAADENPPDSPFAAIAQVLQSGFVGNLVNQIKDGSENGDISIDGLMGVVSSMMASTGALTSEVKK